MSSSGSKTISAFNKKAAKYLYRLAMLGLLIFWSLLFVDVIQEFRANPDSSLADLTSFLWPLLGYVLLIFFILKFKHKFPTKPMGASGIPVWLSQKHLGFEPAKDIDVNLISIDEIVRLSTEYSEGAPALSVSLPEGKLTLISSETSNLLNTLYTLRPDLEPTS